MTFIELTTRMATALGGAILWGGPLLAVVVGAIVAIRNRARRETGLFIAAAGLVWWLIVAWTGAALLTRAGTGWWPEGTLFRTMQERAEARRGGDLPEPRVYP